MEPQFKIGDFVITFLNSSRKRINDRVNIVRGIIIGYKLEDHLDIEANLKLGEGYIYQIYLQVLAKTIYAHEYDIYNLSDKNLGDMLGDKKENK